LVTKLSVLIIVTTLSPA